MDLALCLIKTIAGYKDLKSELFRGDDVSILFLIGVFNFLTRFSLYIEKIRNATVPH